MIQSQTYVFLSSVIVGAILAIIFDIFRIFRRKGNTPNFVVYIQDVFYWIIVTLIIIMSAFITNDGDLRGYMFIGYILGAVIYIVTVSSYILNITGKILDFFERILKKTNQKLKKMVKKNKNVNF